jgi:hypothetical protein
MVKRLLFFFAFSSLFLTGISQTTFIRTIGDNGYYKGISAQEDTSGNLYVLANRSGFAGPTNIIIYKLDAGGNLQKEMTHVSTNLDVATSFKICPSGFVISGYTLNQTNDYQLLLLLIDTLGNTVWRTESGGTEWDFLYDVICIDSSYLVCGKTYNHLYGRSVCFTSKYSGNGDSLSSSFFVFEGDGEGRKMHKTHDSLIYLTGHFRTQQQSRCFVLALSSTGDSTALFSVDTTGNMECYAISQLNNGLLGISGVYEANGDKDGLVLILDTLGGIIYLETHGGTSNDGFYDGVFIANDTLLFAGYSESYTAGQKTAYGVMTTADGVWRDAFISGGKKDDVFHSILTTSDNGLLFTGYTESFGSAQMSVYIVKTDKELEADTANYLHYASIDRIKMSSVNLLLFPNPADDYIKLRNISHIASYQEIKIFDFSGRVVHTAHFPAGEIHIETSFLTDGLYLLHYMSEGRSQTSTFIVQRKFKH